MRSRLARFVLWATRWTAVGDVPRSGVLVGAPHTSNWDFVMMLLIMWRGDVTPRVLIKKELFRGPLGWLLPRLGGIPLDRDNPGAVVRELVREAKSGEPFLLILAAEGTRTKGEYWKSGFWRIARAAKLPIALAFIDGPSRTAGFGPTHHRDRRRRRRHGPGARVLRRQARHPPRAAHRAPAARGAHRRGGDSAA